MLKDDKNNLIETIKCEKENNDTKLLKEKKTSLESQEDINKGKNIINGKKSMVQNISRNNNTNKYNEIDKIPIKRNNLNFLELLEKELSKENKDDNTMNKKEEPKFKYISKRNKKVEFKKPLKVKKYKYYSDNFQMKKKKGNKNNIKTNKKIANNEIKIDDNTKIFKKGNINNNKDFNTFFINENSN